MDSTRIDRTPADVRRTGNRLRHERSLYLRQHAHNPVDWHPWDQAALDLARVQERPIFLSSGYASCHWCHVMEAEVFTADAVAEQLNRHFVCIKVDREEMPDVDSSYMEAVQLLTGGGGWPMSVFLTPDLQPFYGGTYFPRDRFLSLLERIAGFWRTRRADLLAQAGELTEHLRNAAAASYTAEAGKPLDDALVAALIQNAQVHFDSRHGGTAGAMKFPVPVRWSCLLHWWRRSGDPAARAMVERTLTAMAAGGLRDHLGGGFHRYTVDPHWTVPHFEKMLYDNAQLASLFLDAGVRLRRPDFTAVGIDTLEFLLRDMSGEEGPCYASLDADSGGEEGTYYVWTRAQIATAVGVEDGPVAADLLGVGDEGNFAPGASVITRRADPPAVAARHRRDLEAVAGLYERYRPALLAARAERPAPGLDRKIVTGWNGLAISAFVRGFQAAGRSDLLARAERIADYLARVHQRPAGELARASNGGEATGSAVLADYALLAQGLLDLYRATKRSEYLDRARGLLFYARERCLGPADTWFATASAATPLGRRRDILDSVLPSGGSAAVYALLTLADVTGDLELREELHRHLQAQSGRLERAGLEMAGWLSAAIRMLSSARRGAFDR